MLQFDVFNARATLWQERYQRKVTGLILYNLAFNWEGYSLLQYHNHNTSGPAWGPFLKQQNNQSAIVVDSGLLKVWASFFLEMET